MDLFQHVTDLGTLAAGWGKVAANRGGAGGDGQTIGDFAVDALDRLTRLQGDLRGGTYRPGPFRLVRIPKRSGGARLLAIPPVIDRVAQTAAAAVLGPILDAEMEPESYAYRPGRGVRQAVDRVARAYREGYRWVVDADIERFFDTIPHDRLLARLAASIGPSEERIVDLVGLWMWAGDNAAGAASDQRGLVQGSPISPLLANLYLDDLDERLGKRRRGRAGDRRPAVRLVRFADDFVILCRDQATAEGALAETRMALEDLGLTLNPEKTSVRAFDQGFTFLGHRFVNSLVLKQERDHRGDATPGAEEVRVLWPGEDPLIPSLPGTGDLENAVAGEDGLDGEEPDGAHHAPRARALYVMERGRSLDAAGESFVVRDDTARTADGRSLDILGMPARRVARIEVGTEAEVSAAAIRLAAAHGIALWLVDGRGMPQARLDGPALAGGARHLAQAAARLDEDRRAEVARVLIEARIHNQRALLRRLNRTRKRPEVAEAARRISRVIRKVQAPGRANAPDVGVIMGIEGEAAALYWPALGHCLEHGWRLSVRRRRPAPDPVNMILGFLAALLYRELEVMIARHRLHPAFAVLHAPKADAPALASDLAEPFRAPLVEALCVTLFNTRALGPGLFGREEEGRWRLAPEGRSTVIRAWERWMARTVRSPFSDRAVRWRGLLEDQVAAWAAHMEDPSRPLVVYRMDY